MISSLTRQLKDERKRAADALADLKRAEVEARRALAQAALHQRAGGPAAAPRYSKFKDEPGAGAHEGPAAVQELEARVASLTQRNQQLADELRRAASGAAGGAGQAGGRGEVCVCVGGGGEVAGGRQAGPVGYAELEVVMAQHGGARVFWQVGGGGEGACVHTER